MPSAGVQMVLATLHLGNTSNAFQRELQGRVREWESYKDSHNGDWGPSAMALALEAYGAKGYEVHAYQTRQGALRGAAKAIMKTNSPAILLAWRGAHTWVMTGFKADADPTVFSNAKILGHLHPGPVVPRRLEHLGPVRSARHVPEQRRDDPELPAVEAPRRQLPGARRPVHHGPADDPGQPAGLTPMRRTRGARNSASRMSLAITPAA